MAIEEVGVRFVTEGATQFEATMKRANNAVSNFGDNATKESKNVESRWSTMMRTISSPEGFKFMIGAAGSAAAALVGVGMGIKKLADEYMGYAFQVKDFGRIIGATPEEASRLIQVADDVRLSVGSMTTAMRVAINKGYRPTVEGLGQIADAYLAIQDPIERSRFLTETFGRGGLEMAKLLELGSTKIREMGAAVEDGLIITQAGIDKATEYYQQLDQLNDSWTALKMSAAPVALNIAITGLDAVNGLMSDLPPLIKMFAAMQAAMERGAVSGGDVTKMFFQYMSAAKSAEQITDELNSTTTKYDAGLKRLEGGFGNLGEAIAAINQAQKDYVITSQDADKIANQLYTGSISLSEAQRMLADAYTRAGDKAKYASYNTDAYGNALADMNERLRQTQPISPEVPESVEEIGDAADKSASDLARMAGEIDGIPKSVQMQMDFKMPDITSQLSVWVENKKWLEAGGKVVNDFISGMTGAMQGLDAASLEKVSAKLSALELAIKVKIGAMTPAEAEQQLKEAFPNLGKGEAAATIKAALAIDVNASNTAIQDYLKSQLATPPTFAAKPVLAETGTQELINLINQIQGATVPIAPTIAGETFRVDLMSQITTALGGSIPVELLPKLKELTTDELNTFTQNITKEPIPVKVGPVLEQSEIDSLFKAIDATVPRDAAKQWGEMELKIDNVGKIIRTYGPDLTAWKDSTIAVGEAATGAAGQVGALNTQLKSVPKTVKTDIYITTHYKTTGRQQSTTGVPKSGQASGGPVLGNTVYLVGEKGPELFIPDMSGTILPNYQTMSLLNNMMNIIPMAKGGKVPKKGGSAEKEKEHNKAVKEREAKQKAKSNNGDTGDEGGGGGEDTSTSEEEYSKQMKMLDLLEKEMELALNRLTLKEDTTWNTLRQDVSEYNQMVKDGADPKLLAEKKKQIDATAREAEEATKARVAQERANAIKQQQIDEIRHQLELQQETEEDLPGGLEEANEWLAKMIEKFKALFDMLTSGSAQSAMSAISPLVSQSPAPLAVGLEQIKRQLDSLSTTYLPQFYGSVSQLAGPSYYQTQSAASTYNINVPVTATVSNQADIGKLAYAVAKEIAANVRN